MCDDQLPQLVHGNGALAQQQHRNAHDGEDGFSRRGNFQ